MKINQWLMALRRKSMLSRIAAIGASAAVVLAFSSTGIASAATGAICTSNGNHLCLYVPNFNYGTQVVSGPSGSSRTVCAPSAGATGVVKFCGSNAPADRCVDAYSANTYNLQISHCSGVSGVDWYNQDNGDGTRYLINQHYSGRTMAGDNFSGDVWIGAPTGLSGWYYRMQPIE
jgi:hypothetical protein